MKNPNKSQSAKQNSEAANSTAQNVETNEKMVGTTTIEIPRSNREHKAKIHLPGGGYLEAIIKPREAQGGGGQGRPVDENSERQKKLKAMQEKAADMGGELHRGRPTNPNSERQKKLAAMEEKRKAGELKRGRPSDPTSERQQKLKKQEERKAAGEEVKPGRPAAVVEATVKTNVETDESKKVA